MITTMDLRTENAWVYLLLLLLLTDTVSVVTLGQNCAPGEYHEDNQCENCTDCSALGRAQISPCTASTDAICTQNISDCSQNEFLTEMMVCQTCTVCGANEDREKACMETEDTVCVPGCADSRFIYDERQGCVLNCALCPSKICADTHSCMCNPLSEPSSCYAADDITCGNNLCTLTQPPETVPTNTRPPSDNSLPSWGIGLVAIGIVIGIVAFSGCFLVMGFFTSRSRGAPEIGSEESQTSQNGLVTPTNRRNSGSNRFAFMSSPVFTQSTIEVVRNSPRLSPSSKHSGSSYRASPHSIRNSPRGNSPRRHSPKRTGHITPV